MTASPALAAVGVVLGAALLSAAVAGGWWRYARHRVLDLPDERRLHQVPTPRGGGMFTIPGTPFQFPVPPGAAPGAPRARPAT